MASRQDVGWVHGQIVARLDGGGLASGGLRNARLCLLILTSVAVADDTSATDKLRILYSTRFTFTDDGLPLVTVQIMGGKREVKLHAKGGVMVRPDGAGGAAVAADIAKRYAVKTSVHEELVKRPSGTIVARSGSTVIKNPSVIWFQPKKPTVTLVVADVLF